MHAPRIRHVRPWAFVSFAVCVFAAGYLVLHVAVALFGWRAIGVVAGLAVYVVILAATWSATAVPGGRR